MPSIPWDGKGRHYVPWRAWVEPGDVLVPINCIRVLRRPILKRGDGEEAIWPGARPALVIRVEDDADYVGGKIVLRVTIAFFGAEGLWMCILHRSDDDEGFVKVAHRCAP